MIWKEKKPLKSHPKTQYFCDGLNCHYPNHIGDMVFKCSDHRCQGMNYEELKSKYTDLPDDPALFFKTVIKSRMCRDHELPIIPFCCICKKLPIREEMAGSPNISLIGDSNSGKTVYSAVLSHEILCKLQHDFGIIVRPINTNSFFRDKIEHPLFENGLLPDKTEERSPNKLIYTMDPLVKGLKARSISLFDMAGEEATVKDNTDIKDLAELILRAKESIFLIDPQSANDETILGGKVSKDLLGVLQKIFEIFDDHHLLENIEGRKINMMVQSVIHFLEEGNYPKCDELKMKKISKEIALNASQQLRDSFGQETREHLTSNLNEALENLSSSSRIYPFNQQLVDIINYIKPRTVDITPDGKLKHKLAVVLVKADLIPPDKIGNPYDNLSFNESWNPDDKLPNKDDKIKIWQKKMDDINETTKCIYKNLGLNDIIQTAEKYFEEAAFFIVSSLGKGVDFKFRWKRKRHARNITSPQKSQHAASMGEVAIPKSESIGREQRDWELYRIVAKKSSENHEESEQNRTDLTDGTRAIEPKGVLAPLLWLLLE